MFLFYMNQYVVKLGQVIRSRGLMSVYVKTILSQSIIDVTFIISFIGGTLVCCLMISQYIHTVLSVTQRFVRASCFHHTHITVSSLSQYLYIYLIK